MASPTELRREALRLYDRYALEIVEALRICPWAEQARLQGRVARCVVIEAEPEVERLLRHVERIASDPELDISLLICPRIPDGRRRFERRVAELREAHAAHTQHTPPPMAMAAFHPEAEADTSDAERLVPFLRRTPDPTIQLVRQQRLDEVRPPRDGGTTLVTIDQLDRDAWVAGPEPLHRRIAQANLSRVEELGVEEMERRFQAIRRDRNRSYRSLGWT